MFRPDTFPVCDPPPVPAGVGVDIAALSCPSVTFATVAGAPAFDRLPLQAGYGLSPREALTPEGLPAGTLNTLLDLSPLNFDALTGNPDGNSLYDTPVCVLPIGVLTNQGTCRSEITYTSLRYLFTTGRTERGENLVAVSRSSCSPTRNGFATSLCIDPSWAIGEPVGPRSNENATTLLGPRFIPSYKGSTRLLERTVRNHRLAIGYASAERFPVRDDIERGRYELMAVQHDLVDPAAPFLRPTTENVLDNAQFGYGLQCVAGFTTIGDPRETGAGACPPSGLGNPPMRCPEAARFIRNILASFGAIGPFPGEEACPGSLFADPHLCYAFSAQSFVPDPLNPCELLPNPDFNIAIQNFQRAVGGPLDEPAIAGPFGQFSLDGVVPQRDAATGPYSDGLTDRYRDQSGNDVFYGDPLACRNRCAGDFNGDGLRDWNDAEDLVLAWGDRNGLGAWAAPDGSGAIAGCPGGDAVVEILGDFDGDGGFDLADVRYWADGLAVDPATGELDRRRGFELVDQAFDAAFGIGPNLFGTLLATGAAYGPGGSAGDVAGAVGTTPGHAPVGADGVIDGADVGYVYRQFRRNPVVTDRVAHWEDPADASSVDLSADIDGDLKIDQRDACGLIEDILGTAPGDVDLDGVVGPGDLAIVVGNIGLPDPTWSDGDLNGDGVIDQIDVDIVQGVRDPCCVGDANGDGVVDVFDFSEVASSFGLSVPRGTRGDVNGDGVVDVFDFSEVGGDFGCP